MGEAKRKAKLNGGATNSSRHDHFGDFVHAVQNGRGGKLTARDGGRDYSEVLTLEEVADFDFNAPSYDFGNSWSADTGDTIIAAQNKIHELIKIGGLHLPHEHCFFVFSDHGTYVRDTIVEAHEEEDRIVFFFWCRTPYGRWIWQNARIAYRRETGEFAFSSNIDCDARSRDHYGLLMEMCLWSVIVLATKPEDQIIEATELPVKVSTGQSHRQGFAYPTRLIRVRTSAAQRLKALTVHPVSPLTPKEIVGRCPHDRRGHERVYKKTGKRIWIKETKIKGGSPFPRPAVVQVLH